MSKCNNIKYFKIFLFCDGPRNNLDKFKIEEIKKIINLKKKKLNFTKVLYRKKNIGLANNVIKSLDYIFSKNEAAIIIEDDILLGKYAIDFINYYLNILKKNKKIGSVTAYSYLNNYKKNKNIDYYLSKRHSSWGWGTWKRVWKKINWNKINRVSFSKYEINALNFNDLGKDMKLMLWGQSHNYVNSWAIRFNYYCHINYLKSFQSRYSRIENIGNDGSGTHGILYKKKKIELKNINKKIKLNSKLKLFDNPEIDYFIKYSHKKSIRLICLFFLSLIFCPLKKILSSSK